MRRWLAIVWAVACLAVAADTAFLMLVTFAPRPGQSADAASAEVAGLERARVFWVGGAWVTSAILVASGATVAALAWNRPRPPVAEGDCSTHC
jgi:hypothetical protein